MDSNDMLISESFYSFFSNIFHTHDVMNVDISGMILALTICLKFPFNYIRCVDFILVT